MNRAADREIAALSHYIKIKARSACFWFMGKPTSTAAKKLLPGKTLFEKTIRNIGPYYDEIMKTIPISFDLIVQGITEICNWALAFIFSFFVVSGNNNLGFNRNYCSKRRP